MADIPPFYPTRFDRPTRNVRQRQPTAEVTLQPTSLDKKPLRPLLKQAIWHPQTGLVTSPYSSTLPSDFVSDMNSTIPEDYLKPRLLTDENIYLAFYPTKPICRSYLFHDLAIGSADLASYIVAVNPEVPVRERRYTLSPNIAKKLDRLENSLLDVAGALLRLHPHSNNFPILKYPRWPNMFGYSTTHATEQIALSCARRALSAFRMLVAVVSFTFCLWLGKYEDDCFDEAFRMLELNHREKLPAVWLNYLKESIVCDLTPGFRPGGYINPYTTRWGHQFIKFTRASVPIWILWGKEYMHYSPLDPRMVEYLPPDDYIETAKKRDTVSSNLVIPSEQVSPPEHAHHQQRRSNEYSAQSTWKSPDSEPYRDNYQPGFDFVTFDHTSNEHDQVDRTQIVYPNSYQRPGESWEMFRGRKMRSLERRIETETPREKQQRLSNLQASSGGPVAKSKVYIWERDEVIPSFYRRKIIEERDEIRYQWHQQTEHQRFYWPHDNVWDLVPHLPPYPDGTAPPVNEPHDPYNDDGHTFASDPYPVNDEVSTLEKQTSDPVAPMMLETVRSITAPSDVEPNDAYIFKPIPFLEYLRRRHGFAANLAENWTPDAHHDLTLPTSKSDIVFTIILYEKPTPAPSKEIAESMVNFFNTCLLTQNYTDLPRSWDISPQSGVVPPLICDMSRLRLQRVAYERDERTALYILRPSTGSSDPSQWYIATTSATTILLIYRSQWSTMREIGHGLLELGIPFRTVVEKPRLVRAGKRAWSYKWRGLGRRPQDFIATEEDFLAYQRARDDILYSPHGRAVRLQGGIAGRIAAEIVDEAVVLDGPSGVYEEVVGHHGDINFVDDMIDEDPLDIVCGVYHVDQTSGGSVQAQLSWWPKASTWCLTGLGGDQWLPRAEAWYQKRLEQLRSSNRGLVNASKWKESLKFSKSRQKHVYDASNKWAAMFLAEDGRLL